MQILIDYCVFTSKIHSVESIKNLLGLNDIEFINIKSFYGYPFCEYYQGIKIHYGREDVCIDMSGTGCRTLEQIHNCNFDWYEFFKSMENEIYSKEVHFSRIDVACDEYEGLLKYDILVKYIKEHKYVCKSKLKPYWTDGREQAIYFGSSKSDRRLRIYNKALEQEMTDIKWIRAEFQLRNESATSFLLNYFNCFGDIGKCYFGIMIDYLKFVNVSVDEMTGQNYSRLVCVQWWKKFTDNALALKQLYLQGKKYDINNIDNYVKTYCSSNLKALVMAYDGDLSKIIEYIENAKLNSRQKMAISEAKNDNEVSKQNEH